LKQTVPGKMKIHWELFFIALRKWDLHTKMIIEAGTLKRAREIS
jgi:hypothetical protein